MRLGAQQLNRTLLRRQHLLGRTDATLHDLVGHLIGLQAQDPLPPYLSLAARLRTFDPREVTRAQADRSLVRLLSMRGTVHLLAPDDALTLRPWVQPRLDDEEKHSQNVGAAREVDRQVFAEALAEALAAGPLPLARLGDQLAARIPGHDARQLGQLARVRAPLVQLPPRGAWKESGGVVYEYADRWLGGPLVPRDRVDVEAIVRRYLAAFGPATAADVTAWSGVTRLGPLVKAMVDRGDLARHKDDGGRILVDVPDGEVLTGDEPAPVRLLGVYDNLWLSHAARDRVTVPAKRRRWMGANGGTGCALLVDGWLEGLWRVADGRVEVVETFRRLTRSERAELDEETKRVEALLSS